MLRIVVLAILICIMSCGRIESQSVLFFEDFESGDFAAKGWYDGFPDQRTTDEAKHGMYAYEGHFL